MEFEPAPVHGKGERREGEKESEEHDDGIHNASCEWTLEEQKIESHIVHIFGTAFLLLADQAEAQQYTSTDEEYKVNAQEGEHEFVHDDGG